MRFNYQNIFLFFFFPNSYSTSKKYTMNITGGVLAKSLESVYSIFVGWFVFLNQTVHITPRLFTEGHTLLSAMDYALLPSTAYAKSKAVNALDSTGAGRVSGGRECDRGSVFLRSSLQYYCY